MDQERVGHFMVTASGRAFWPKDPRPEEVTIEDIATHLSKQCRFNGACRGFYSVGQHSVIVSRGVEAMLRSTQETGHTTERDVVMLSLWGLLHDGAEAYCGDVIWPVKQDPVLKDAFKQIEGPIQRAVCDRFGLPHEEPDIVVHGDLRALATEKRDLVPRPALANHNTALRAAAEKARTGAWHCDTVEPFKDRIFPLEPWAAQDAFLERYYELVERMVR